MMEDQNKEQSEELDIQTQISNLEQEVQRLQNDNLGLESTVSELRESVSSIDEDDYIWTKITGASQYWDIPIQKFRELQERSWAAFNLNPIAMRRITFITNLVTGRQLQFLTAFSDIKNVIDSFWKNPLNKMPLKIKEYVNQAQLDGEIFIRFFINTNTGEVVARIIPSNEIVSDDDIICDPDDPEVVLYFKRRYYRRTYNDGTYLSQSETEYIPSVALMDERDTDSPDILKSNKVKIDVNSVNKALQGTKFTESFMYQIKISSVSNKKRGMPVLSTMLYWLTEYKNILKSRILLNKARAAHVLDVAVEGDEPAVKAEAAKHKYPPRPGSVMVHSTKVTYEYKSPSINADDVASDMRNVKLMVVAGSDLPEDILTGDTKEAKVASSKSTKFAFIKTVEATQDFWRWQFLYGIVYVVLYAARRWGKKLKEYYYVEVPLTTEEQKSNELAEHAGEYTEDLEGIENKPLLADKGISKLPNDVRSLLEDISTPGRAEASSQLGLLHPHEDAEHDGIDEIKKPKATKVVKKLPWELIEVIFPEVDTEEITALAQAFNIFTGIGIASKESMSSKAGFDWGVEKERMKKEGEDAPPPSLGGLPPNKKGLPQKPMPMPAGGGPPTGAKSDMAKSEELDPNTASRFGAIGGSRSPVQDSLKK